MVRDDDGFFNRLKFVKQRMQAGGPGAITASESTRAFFFRVGKQPAMQICTSGEILSIGTDQHYAQITPRRKFLTRVEQAIREFDI